MQRCIYLCGREESERLRHVCHFLLLSLEPPLLTSPSLQSRKELEWQSKVGLLFGDMRSIDIPEKADILVTELLGSFGDNELSPECLDGAVRFLKREFQV